jgi:DNA-binding MarR family transcriptional regulator
MICEPTGTITDRQRGEEAPHALASRARKLFLLRQTRNEIFHAGMFGEPAWDILLVLYGFGSDLMTGERLARLVCASINSTTRWIDYLEGRGLVVREARRVTITDEACSRLEKYLMFWNE